MKHFIIYNPGAKSGSNKGLLKVILSRFQEYGLTCAYAVTGCLEDACHASIKANREGYGCIITVGGDGTINKVLNGFYDDNGRRISQAKLGVIHTGTSPDFCKSYAIPFKVPAAIECILNGQTKSIRVGQITLSKSYKPECHNYSVTTDENFVIKYFACCANIGLGASLARYANQGIRKYLGDFAGTFISLLRVLVQYKPTGQFVTIDGQDTFVDNFYNMSAGISRYIASGIQIKNDLAEKDDRFYIFIVKNLSLRKIPLCLRTVYSGNAIENSDYFTLNYGKKIEIYGNKQNPEVEFDGDPAGFLPCRIQMAKDALEVFTNE
jgi:diacylglycerol kinase family enzyme